MVRLGIHYIEPRRAAFFGLEVALSAALALLLPSLLAPGPASVGGAAGAALLLAGALSLGDLHDVQGALDDARRGSGRLLRLLGALLAAIGLVALVAGLRLPLLASLPAALLAVLLCRAALPAIDAAVALRTRVLLIGEGRAAHQLLREVQRGGAVEVVGFCGPRAGDLVKRARQAGARTLVVATEDRRGLAVDELLGCRLAGLEVIEAPLFAARALHRLPVELLRPSDLIYGDGFQAGASVRLGRRVLSAAAALLLLLSTAPLLAAACLAIRLDSRGPILFRQRRVGRGGAAFEMLKLRTMRDGAERGAAVWAKQGDPRVTRVGRWLRRFRVDELPQLINVLRGDMELVGPRPERPEFVADLRRRIPFYDLRHLVRPGITGWAQVCYPYAASVEEAREKLQYDLYYVRHEGVGFDLFVLLLTARTVLLGQGAR